MTHGLFDYASTDSKNKLDAEFAVIDIETSGLSPGRHRVIEIAIVRLDSQGHFIDEISTLVNPGDGNVGPKHIHKISEKAVATAPTFEEFLPQLKNWVSEAIIVAHNAIFEEGFLKSELVSLNSPNFVYPCIDTLPIARSVLPTPNHQLQTIVEYENIEVTDTHTALGDARLLAKVLPKLIEKSSQLTFAHSVVHHEFEPYTGRLRTRASDLKKGTAGWMAGVLRKLPYSGLPLSDPGVTQYLNLLEIFLQDGKLTGAEVKELVRVAGESGYGAVQISELHKQFIENFEIAALADGILDPTEQTILANLKQLLTRLD